MKILGRIKKSKVLTAVMTAVLIFQSACPTGLAYAAEQARSSAVLTVTASVEDLDETLPTVQSPTDFTAGSAVGTCPAYWTAHEDGTSFVESLAAKKQKQGLALNWYDEDTGAKFDWYKTKVTKSTSVIGKWEKYDVSVTFSANDGTTKSDTETVPYGQSYKQAFGKEKAAPATRKGYEFDGWYDSTTNKKFDFTKKLTDPTVSVYAKWNLKDAVEVAPTDASRPAQTATGTCTINGTWFGSPFEWGSIARFNLSNFTGELAGASMNDAQCVDSGAENPYLAGRRTASYQATLASFDETTGKAVYDVYVYPAGHATGDMYVKRPPYPASQGTQQGVQRIHATATVYKVVKGYIELQKASTCTNVSDNNKLYSIAGAEFSIYDASGKFVQKLTTNEKGETGRSGLLTAGTYTVKETKAPEGYYAADDFTVTVNAGQVTKKTVGDKPLTDPLQMIVGKFDGEKTYNGAGNLPQGSATLADAEFTVDYYDTFDYDNYDDLKKADIEPTRSWTFKTDEDGFATFTTKDFVSGDAFYYNEKNDPCIPRGTIVVRETKAPTGYLKSNAVSFQKIMDGYYTDALKTYNAAEVPEQVYRSDFEFTKKAENGSDRLAGVPFKVTSLTTGESHIAVTDENGYFSSASSWNAHDGNTNANDWALTADGTIDSSKLNASAGFWFGNTTTGDAIKADNSLGAMPFDTYSVEELRCTANEGYALVNTTVTVSRNGASIDFGTLDDPEPEIHTTAYDASDSDHYIGVSTVKVTDKVEYSHLVAGKTYTVTGEVHDAKTGDVLKVNGKTVTAEKTFTAEESHGSVTVDFSFDSYDLAGKTLVVYETLTDAKGAKLAEHKDKDDVSQQVTVLTPKLSTSAVSEADNSKSVTAEGDATVTDYVRYTGLTAGQTYTLTGTLMDKSTKKAFEDADGNPVTATAVFTAEAESGTATVTFTFDASGIKTGAKLVAFETLSTNGIEIANHKDINDIDQTVTVKTPVIGTTAVDAADGDKTVTGEENVSVRDTVHYNNVTPGKTYKVSGTLYEKVIDKDGKVTKKAFKDKNGNPVTAEANFTAEDSYGNVDVTFYFDGSSLKEGTSLVAFESLSYNDKEIASHADVNDAGQTVTIGKPKLSTSATDALDGDKNLIGEDGATIVDTVHYNNVTPGKTYKVSGTLYEKVTDKDGKVSKKQLLDADGNPVTAETEFVPEASFGDVDVTFTFDASDLKAKDKVVAFESLSLNGKELASHADIEDKSQTVTITKPEVGTTAKDGLDGNKTVVSDTEVSVVDTVKYKNVTPGKTYKVSGTLYEKVTDKDGKVSKKQLLDADGNPVTAETEFVPDDTYGTVDVTFTFDGSLLKDNTPVVAFESLSYKDKEIASHSDIEDEDQTVTMHTSEIGTTATDKLDGDKTVIADAESTVTDKVEYNHVLTGKAYTMAGILMDAKTGLPVLTGEGAKKYTEDDLTKFTSGLMNVLGFQSNTYSIKVKDKDWGNGAAIVKNADGSYTYDASERTENEDGTWTVKTATQTLTEQKDGTWKLTGLEGSGSGTADGGTSFVRNIEETYKADEVEVTDNGIDWSNAKKLPTASIDLAKVKAYAEENKDLLSCLVYKTAEFTPEKESGSIDMDYTFNSNDVIDRLSGETKNLVVFEVMFKGSIENASDETPVSIVASECDKDNEGQTVKLAPSTIGTTATDKSDGDHELMAGKDAVITDEVKYEGLIPGKEYTLHATLMDKKTGEPLKVADKGVTAELKFTPNSESGTVSINLGEFDATSLDGHTLVVFEELTKQSDIDGKTTDVTVAEHKDINDEGQSVTVTSTPAGSTYGKTGVDMTNIAIAIGILLIAAGCATAYGIKSRKTTKGDADESAEDNTEA